MSTPNATRPNISKKIFDVVMFTSDDPIDRRILLEAESLIDAGYSVIIVIPEGNLSCGNPDFVIRMNELRVSTQKINKNFSSKIINTYRILRPVLQKIGFNITLLRSIFWSLLVSPEDLYLGLFEPALKVVRGRVFVAHDLPMLPVALAAAAQQNGRVVFDSHELFAEQDLFISERRVWRRLETRLIKQADRVITVNQSIAAELARRYAIPVPEVIANCERWRPHDAFSQGPTLRELIGVNADRRIILFQGGLLPNRNLANLVRAMAHVQSSRAILVLLGDGPLKISLRRIVERENLNNCVFFLDAVPQDQLLELTRGADVGIIPYRASCLNTYLCTPNKLYEFIMARLPIIAADLPEIRVVIERYGIGRVGDVDSATSIAKLIDSFFSRTSQTGPELAARLEHAADELCWEREAPKLVATIRVVSTRPESQRPGFVRHDVV
ncbi:glycosyltransferase [Ferruginivarius sediminum]|nr:glycosyltransferase [Ferruginivarius sediminum]